MTDVGDPGLTEPRDAATVVLLRDGADGLEAWLLTRVAQMVFAPGMTVFPGGRVDEADGDVPWAGRPAAEFAEAFGCAEGQARAFVAAAVRETFEETTVLLTRPSADLSAHRADVEAHVQAFGTLLRSYDLAIDADAVRPWARWVTPEGEVRRYDTRFFVARLPAGARARDVTGESSTAEWLAPDQALADAAEGRRVLLPPTRAVLSELAALGSVAAVLAAAEGRDLAPVRSVLRRRPDGVYVELPDGTTDPLPDGTLPT